jgi:hypothetical protein
MTKKETNSINERFIPELEKSAVGYTAELMDYENEGILLRVSTEEEPGKSVQEFALEVASAWRNKNPELQGAKAYRVFLTTKHTGFVHSTDIRGTF